ncbi:NAD-dependent epimerase/dehydratase family protein [Micromonospora sp. WMMA1363]|uniref:NAD-dependent epimerase/dehydratase family protein n=1 Tax=Micromonospora sp. WMMA1363 TaxID=3053985 RepID=UPI00259C9BFA|nr:NAD-dependent epimerase/dehydratase family protein [Micromonospora sp. WMMA1363]MDM4719573.1 NAD-dependent epimerase/dehydratase family protein [Micromonospora sp. WMMA1363]
MEHALVTGATGTVGSLLVRDLADRGVRVRALLRSPERAAAALPQGVEAVRGDVIDLASVRSAVKGCDTVFHTAGLPEQWLADPDIFEQVNVNGTRHLVEAALTEGVATFVYTSTIDVFDRVPGVPFDESRTLEERPLGSAYERSKQKADLLVAKAVERGLPARIVHPSAVYGPGPATATAMNLVLLRLARNQIPVLPPGGMPVVFTEDVSQGHLLAAEAPIGSRWILSDCYLTMTAIAELVHTLVPTSKVPRTMPTTVAATLAAAGEVVARVIRRPPLLAAGELYFLRSHSLPDSSRARSRLGWHTTSVQEGLSRTLRHFGVLR